MFSFIKHIICSAHMNSPKTTVQREVCTSGVWHKVASTCKMRRNGDGKKHKLMQPYLLWETKILHTAAVHQASRIPCDFQVC